MYIEGAAVGFLLGGLFLSIYVDLGVQTTLTSKSEEWVGAWWLGFLVSIVLAMLWSAILMGFPMEFPRTQKLKKLNLIGNANNVSSMNSQQDLKVTNRPQNRLFVIIFMV